MTSIILEGPIADVREREVKLLFDAAETINTIGHEDAATDRERLLQNAGDLRDMFFMVVVVGEFNAGKSTFVNSLLGEELLPTGVTPTTEVIELIRYGTQKTQATRTAEQATVREWTHPNTGGPGVVIVDTPGTGSVFAKHERLAKQFLSRSDLVLFLLSAKKAFAQTERIYLELARDYGKKIILILNQVDLLDKQERKEVEAFVKQQVSELVNLDPPLFSVSAKKALQNKRPGGLFSRMAGDDSGMETVREYLQGIFERVPPAKQKLVVQLDFTDSITRKYQAYTNERLRLTGADRAYAEQLKDELQAQGATLADRLNTTMRELDRVFDGLLERGRRFINQNLTLGKGLRPPDRDLIREKFEKEVVGTALSQISDISEDYVSAVVDSSRRYWRNIIDRLNKLQALMEKEISSPDAGSYADQRTALQEAIAIADAELKTYKENNLAESLRDTFATNMSRFTMSVTGLVGGILAIAIGVAVPQAVTATAIGILGALVIGPALAVGGTAGVLLYGRKVRRDALKELDDRLKRLRESYRQALEGMTERERTRLLQYGQEILAPVFSRLEVLAKRYQEQHNNREGLTKRSKQLREELDRIEVQVEV
jgi:small GTP-binding protein